MYEVICGMRWLDREIAPNEPAIGVTRDSSGRRCVRTSKDPLPEEKIQFHPG